LAPVVIVQVYVRLGTRLDVSKRAVVSEYEYDTVPEIGVVPCRTVKVVVFIDFGSIGVLKVAVITLTAATLANPVVPLVLLRDKLPLLMGDVLVTLGTMGAIQAFTIPGSSSLHPAIKTTKSKAAVSTTTESDMPRNPPVVLEKCVHRLKAVVGFVVGVFMDPSVIS
jgi:hypothetical protein